MTEVMKIFLYLLLTIVEGAMVAVFRHSCDYSNAAFGVWLALQITSFKKRSNRFR